MHQNNTKDYYLKCTNCGKIVSSVPFISDAIVRAYVECPECIAKGNNEQTKVEILQKIDKEK